MTTLDFTALLLGTLGHAEDEFTSLLYIHPGDGTPHTAVMAPADAVAAAAQLPDTADVYFGVNPVAGPARTNAGKGREADVTRLAALFCDLDVKPGACPSVDVAKAIVAELGIIVGTRPSAVVYSGGGVHAYWPILDGHDTTTARAILKRWYRLVAAVAEKLGAGVDNVYNLDRVLRLPGTFNHKTGTPRPVTAEEGNGGPLELAEVAERLDEVGIFEIPEDTAEVDHTEVSTPAEWLWAESTCGYVVAMVDGFATDSPKKGKGRSLWLIGAKVRLNCAKRLGCITEADYRRAEANLTRRFAEVLADPAFDTPRAVKKYEHRDTMRHGVKRAAAKTAEQCRAELGGHTHPEDAVTKVGPDEFAHNGGDSGVAAAESPPSRVARVQWAGGIRPERQVWLWDNRIPVGTVSALAGRGGCGKTTYALHLAALLSRGRLPGQHHGQPKPTLVWSGEDQWAPVLVPRLIAAGADLDLIGRLHIEAQDGVEVTPRLPLDTATLRSAITASGAALVIIDPIASTMSGDLHREDDVRQALDALARVASDTGAVVMFVRHFGKGGGNASDKMSGSHAFRDAVRSVFLFAADEDRVVVTQDKGNYAPPGEESFAFRLDGTEVDTDTGPAPVARVVELGACEVSVTDIINRAPERTAEAEDDERDYTADFKASWLYAYLAAAGAANTPVRPKDAVAYAADKGISRRSVFRLFEKLANAGLAVSEDSDGFPRVTHWRVDSGTTGPAHQDGGTTGTTGADLHKHDGTTARSAQDGGTTGGTVADQQEQANTLPVVPVVPPPAGVRAAPAPPGGITENTPGQTARMALALAKATQAVTA